jgi:hypothetical protein
VRREQFFSRSLEQEDLSSINSKIIIFFNYINKNIAEGGEGGVRRFPNYNKGGFLGGSNAHAGRANAAAPQRRFRASQPAARSVRGMIFGARCGTNYANIHLRSFCWQPGGAIRGSQR